MTAGELQRFAASRLAFHKIPRQVFFLDKIPLGASGKPSRRLTREALPTPPVPLAPIHVAPRNPMEQALARLWSDELRVPEPGIHDHFFDSGGDSLGAVSFLSSVSQELKCERLPMGLMMEAHHCGDSRASVRSARAARVQRGRAAAARLADTPVPDWDTDGVLPTGKSGWSSRYRFPPSRTFLLPTPSKPPRHSASLS